MAELRHCGRRRYGAPRRQLLENLADPKDQAHPKPLHEGLLAIVETPVRGLSRRIEIVDKQIGSAGAATHPPAAPITIPAMDDPVQAMAGDRAALRADGTSAASPRRAREDGHGRKGQLRAISKRGQRYLRRCWSTARCGAVQQERQGGSLVSNCRDQGAQRSPPRALGNRDGAHRVGGDDTSGGLPRPAADQLCPDGASWNVAQPTSRPLRSSLPAGGLRQSCPRLREAPSGTQVGTEKRPSDEQKETGPSDTQDCEGEHA